MQAAVRGGGQLVDGLGKVGGVELPEEPFVEGAEDGVLAEGDVAGVLDVVGQAVLSGEGAR